MTEKKPYLLRAIYSWILDNGCTPHLIIAYPGNGWVSGVPDHLLQEAMLVLNISPQATQNLLIDNDYCQFHTRFSGQAHHVFVSIEAIHALVARENGEGYTFDVDMDSLEKGCEERDVKPIHQKQSSLKSTNHLKIIK